MTISFNHIPAGLRVPLFYAEVDNSKANTATTKLRTLLIGQMTSSGKATAGVPVIVQSDTAGKELFGRGSVLARMNSVYRQNDPTGEVWAIPLTDLANGVAAIGGFLINGPATGAGVLSLYVGSKLVQVSVALGDTAQAIATAAVAAINTKRDLPVTAVYSSVMPEDEGEENPETVDFVKLTAKCSGIEGNDLKLGVNLAGFAGGETLPEGVSASAIDMAGGAGVPDFDTLGLAAAMGDDQYDFIVLPYCDSTSLNALATIMNDHAGRWSYAQQLYGHVYACRRDTLSGHIEFCGARNNQHETVIAIEPATPSPADEVLAAYAAQNAAKLAIDPARPTQTLELIGVTPAPHGARFVMAERESLLGHGCATQYVEGGYMRVERAITTYQTNSFGDPDNSYLDSETMHTIAYVIRDLRTRITSKYPRHKLASDGTRFGAGQAVVTPSVIRAELIAAYRKLERKAIVENADLFAENLIVERDEDDPNRLNVLFPPDLVNQLRVFALQNQFRLQYEEE